MREFSQTHILVFSIFSISQYLRWHLMVLILPTDTYISLNTNQQQEVMITLLLYWSLVFKVSALKFSFIDFFFHYYTSKESLSLSTHYISLKLSSKFLQSLNFIINICKTETYSGAWKFEDYIFCMNMTTILLDFHESPKSK